MAKETTLRTESSLFLPPPDTWLIVPGANNRAPTPVTELGLVDTDRLIPLVKSTVSEDFSWELHAGANIHHLYWPHNRYPDIENGLSNPGEFRELYTNQIVIPTIFHNWLHLVTEAPEPPSKEVMAYRIEADRVVRKLFRTARLSTALTRARYMPQEKFERGSEYHLWQFLVEVEEAQKLPPEFYPIDLKDLDPSTPEELRALTNFLGKAIARSNRTRDVRMLSARLVA